MKISLSWLADYIDVAPLKNNLTEILEKLTMRGLEVEQVQDLSKGLEKVVIAEIKERNPHPNADRLSVCKVNDGSQVLQIVCGAKNMKVGDKVALSQVGALLPNGVKIEKGKIRDVESFGMLCSEVELGIAETSEGILILNQNAPVGKPLAPFLGLDDIVFEINVTPNRGDALSFIGVARELAAITGQKVKLPVVSKLNENGSKKTSKRVKLFLENPKTAPDACIQYHGRVIEGVKVADSPEWLQKRLKSVGLRPINNVVDITNFVLMEWGTPLHAFDFSKLKGAEIRVRLAQKGEKIPLLDETTVDLAEQDLVIADAEKPVALAGVMGGGNSSVSTATKDLLLETAQFAPETVRRTAKRHQKHTDSSHRFERQIDFKAVKLASDRASSLIQEIAGGKICAGLVSATSPKANSMAAEKLIQFNAKNCSKFLGTKVEASTIAKTLTEIGFTSKANADEITTTIPSFRPDVEILPDVYEEFIRAYGYDKIDTVVPRMHFIPDPANKVDRKSDLVLSLKEEFMNEGFSEVIHYAFVPQVQNQNWGGENAAKNIQLANPLNEDFSTLKTSLIGSLIETYKTSVNHQQLQARIFEIRPTYIKDETSETGVKEIWKVAGLISGRAYAHPLAAADRSVDFFDLKGILERVLEGINCRGLRFELLKNQDTRLHPGQSSAVVLGKGPCGFLGRLHPKRELEYKFRTPVYIFEFEFDRALEMVKLEKKFQMISKFPKVPRDLSLIVPKELTADKITQALQKFGKPLIENIAVVDVYQGDKIPKGTYSLSVTFNLSDPNRTLDENEIDLTTQKLLSGLEKELSVKLRTQ